ncbi:MULTISPECIES: hypothetical protein [unclassified Mesorhizobium]|uniref:hypothetical protein n=1 Tax=unclassified Mesorhizobium TaxID=325217 RepID=UPI001CC9589E|nr:MULTISPECIES: hypothetical protein [unclassified Mesorhizobium]MBZ9741522.1 hypothetical protein [Mesorhizobium sp. CO1-1-4]MBZ9805195.1 hypothetical protein [Mesorhizobium sp. ES1-6]
MNGDAGTIGPHLDIDAQEQAALAREARDRQQSVVGRKAQILGASKRRKRCPNGLAGPERDGRYGHALPAGIERWRIGLAGPFHRRIPASFR